MSLSRRFRRNRRKKYRVVKRDDFTMAVIRPADPAISIAETKRIVDESQSGKLDFKEADKQFHAILDKQESFTFVGLATKDPNVILSSQTLEPIEGAKLEPGDSFVPWETMEQCFTTEKPE